ncbi:MAG TPA: FAD-dependent oxidoreductase [Geobacterales bacterium]|nr:FAD-dependent oxidoreductase [Geobacterales bacterium]
MGKETIAIIGRGIVGLTTGYRLLEKGYNVIFIDDSPYQSAASWNNAGLISPTYSALSPSIGTIKDISKWMFSKNSGIRISTSSFFKNLNWIWSYVRKSSLAMREEIMKLVYDMIKEAVEWYDMLSKKINFDFKKDGLIEVYLAKENFDKRVARLENYPKLGSFEIMDAKSVLELEPNLNKEIVGGIFYPEEASLDPRKLMLKLISYMRDSGVNFFEERALRFKLQGSRVSSLSTNKSEVKADFFVIATGAHKEIYKSLNLRVPVIAGRGYAVITDAKVELEHHISAGDYRISIAQLEEGNLKATGFLEFAGVRDEPRKECFDFLHEKLIQYIPNAKNCKVIETWLGSRPCTPDLMPIIDRIKDNLFINVGHCRVGVCLAPFSSRLLVELLEKGRHDYDLFSMRRFA